MPWHVTHVRVLPRFQLHVRFIDGTEGEVDLRELILSSTAGVFAVLRDAERFAQATVQRGAVSWPAGLDLAPDAMYAAIAKSGRWVVPPFAPRA